MAQMTPAFKAAYGDADDGHLFALFISVFPSLIVGACFDCETMGMEFKRFIRRLFRLQTRTRQREDSIAKIEALGFKLLDLRGWHQGKHAPRRYHLVDPVGNVLDNAGEGYHSTSSAQRAAERASAERR